MGVVGILHQTDEQLELYALGRLPEPRLAEVEEHLLVCASCQERLDDLEMYAGAMRQAIAAGPAAPSRAGWVPWSSKILGKLHFSRLNPASLKRPALAWACVFAAIVLTAGLLIRFRPDIPPLASLQLTAVRGDVQSVTPARETDIALLDAPAGLTLRAGIVDAIGATVWSGALEAGSPRIALMKQLAPGNYFVRLYDGDGKLLHEYGFRVRAAL